MSVITISRSLGSMGTYIGKRLAERLGYAYIDKHQLARIMREYGFSNFDNIYEKVPTLWERMDEYREMTIQFLAATILAVAQMDDVVIAGRGGFGLLDAYRDVTNVRIKAPFSCRVHRVMQERGVSQDEAEAIVTKKDRIRKNFVESDFRFAYYNSREFDLILDTSIVPPDMCVDWLYEVHQNSSPRRVDDDRPSVTSIEVEPVLKNHIRRMIKEFSEERVTIQKGIESEND